jgi:cytochrome c biogenesis protein CcmG/thiol:disulfide interchange protein DsbE
VKQWTDRILLGMIAVMVAALAWKVSGSLAPRIVKVGDRAPQFRIVTDHGKTITPTDFGGKLLVLNFWASWCVPCVQEIPSLEAFHEEFEKQGVVVVGISMDANPRLYQQFLEQYNVGFQTARDPSWDISASYGTFQIPETYIIDTRGRVVQKIINAQNWMNPVFLDSVRKLL